MPTNRPFGAKPNPLKRGQVGIGMVRKQLAMRGSARQAGTGNREHRKMLEGAPMWDQIGNSCVGYTVAQCLEALDYVSMGKRDSYSGLSAYYYGRKEEALMDGEDLDLLPDDGTYPFAALVALKKHGICHERAWPHRPEFLQSGPPGWGAVRQSEAHRTTYFYAVDDLDADKYETIRAAVLSDCPVAITIPVVDEFLTWGAEPYRQIQGPLRGYHRLPILGWTASGCGIIRSSWARHGDAEQNLYFAPELLSSDFVTDVDVFFDGVTT